MKYVNLRKSNLSTKLQVLLAFLSLLPTINHLKAKPPTELNLAQTVTQLTCDKQVVVLGELPSHGEALGFQAKADIVQYLTEQCDFTALFFEAPMYDFLGFQQAITDKNTSAEQLDRAIGGFWTTQELNQWRQWLFTQSTTGELTLAGLDDQISASSDFAKTTLPQLVGSTVPTKNGAECQQAIKRNLHWHYDAEHQYDTVEMKLLQQCAKQATDKLATSPDTDYINMKMADNLANLYSRQNNTAGALNRDAIMYKNFQWQYKRLPKGSKVIIWTATVHAARQQGGLKRKPLGAWLAEQWNDNVAVIGFTTYSGQSSMAGMTIKPIPDASIDSLEALVTSPDSEWTYLTALELRKLGSISSRLYGQFMTTDWSTLFDGVVVFREEKAPTFKQKKQPLNRDDKLN